MHRRKVPIRTMSREEFNKNIIPPKREKRKVISPLRRPIITKEEWEEYNKPKNSHQEKPVTKNTQEEDKEQEQEQDDEHNWEQEEEETFDGNYEDE